MPPDVQPKLLRVLQEKVYYRVGSGKPQEADFRLISSTNRDPFDSIKDGQLREDLYYRINTIEITIPPLRDRMEDVPMLAEHFLQIYAEKYHQDNAKFSEHAYNQMLNYNWRGNVRELQHAIERAVLLSRKGVIETLDIPRTTETPASIDQFAEAAAVRGAVASVGFSGGNSGGGTVTFRSEAPKQPASIEEIGKLIVDGLPDPKDGAEPKDIFNELESGVVLAALQRTKGNKQAAAQLLGLYRPRLYGMIKRHNLEERL
jgi:DNA-binding NtrC family response regulator